MKRSFMLVLVLFTFTSVVANKSTLKKSSKAPKGFEWVEAKEIRAALLMPIGWNFKHAAGDTGTQAYFLTLEKIKGKNGRFFTGFSVNVIKNIKYKTDLKPSEYAEQVMQKLKSQHKYRDYKTGKINKYFSYAEIQIVSKDNKGVLIKQVIRFVYNDIRDTLYICIFESPETSWKQYIKYGDVIFNNMVLEKDY